MHGEAGCLAVTDYKPLGKHLVSIEADTVVVVLRGTVELSEVQELAGIFTQVHNRLGRVFVLPNVQDGAIPPLKVRRWLVQWLEKNPVLTAGAAFGASLPLRTIFLLLMRAAAALRRMELPVVAVATEAEAREFISRVRANLVVQLR